MKTTSVAVAALNLNGENKKLLVAELAAQKKASKEEAARKAAIAKEAKKNKVSTRSIGSSKISAQIKKTVKNEHGVEVEAKGALSIYGLSRMPVTKYLQTILSELQYVMSPECAAVIRRDAENASFRFGELDSNGVQLAEKGTARTVLEAEKLASVLLRLHDATKDIFDELMEDATNVSINVSDEANKVV